MGRQILYLHFPNQWIDLIRCKNKFSEKKTSAPKHFCFSGEEAT